MAGLPEPRATAAQVRYLAALGVPAEKAVYLSRQEASRMIERLQKERDAGLK